MELHILWMYHDIKDVFGDFGNIQTLRKRLLLRNIDCHVDTCGVGEPVDFCKYDLVYMGTNINYEDTFVYEDLMKRKSELQKAMDHKIAFLLVCGGFQMFGSHFISDKGMNIPALHFFDYYTDYQHRSASIQNICVETALTPQRIIGFENHRYQIFNVKTPLGKVIMGNGNNSKDHDEGFINDHVMATNIHGPLLPKNPELADKILQKAISRNYFHMMIEPLEDRLEEKAREVLLKRWNLSES